MHDIHLYLKYANSNVLFPEWRAITRFCTANLIFPYASLLKQKKSQELEFPKSKKKIGVAVGRGCWLMEILKMMGSPLIGVFTPPETTKDLTSNDCLINKGMKHFEAEVINTNENT